MPDRVIRPTDRADRGWMADLLRERWGAAVIAVHGELIDPLEQSGLAAFRLDAVLGLLTYRIQPPACEILTLDSLAPGQGVGGALIAAVEQAARRAGCSRLWLITTNDNLHALGFYQKRGFRLAGLQPGAVAADRSLKPEIPLIGENGIPIRDELELEKWLEGGPLDQPNP